ncbi:DUF3168 domain-containing protein [Mesorhizobium sp. BR-1-1-10]|uniref:DUF3168 domain-containing protein n=1 Tax=Mesorhizobium sp. BR-1-1-10 TaxID=2876660 RepID=UPI001CD18EA0|nr:DUF3168 domain-containing protein [Mesorhizobium sp. BR-1-1-10]MBZ9975481.1 DUF3168 domain-containing protein [Mesorhizobium sp. BR-1-1-10]
MADTAVPVIKGIIAALKASAPVVTLVGTRIYSDVPQDATFPYLVVSVQSEPFAANDFSGQSHTVRLQAHSRKSTISEALLIRAAAMTALDRNEASISLDAGTLVKCEYSGLSDAFIEDDGKTWQSVGELEVIVV